MSDREEHNDLLEQATEALRDEPFSLPPVDLFARTQARVDAVMKTLPDRPARSPLFHPLVRIAAGFTILVGGAGIYFAMRHAPSQVVGSGEPAPAEVAMRSAADQADRPKILAQTSGAVHGLVRFTGVAPKPQPLSMAANAHCAAHHRGEVIDESILVNDDGTLRNVVVWVSGGLEGRRFEPPLEPAVLDQQGCVYTPHVVTVMTGQRLLVKNSDPFLHNVHAAADHNPPFNFGQPTIDGGKPLVFLAPDQLFVKCDVHPWMSAYIHVVDNPFFGVTGRDGSFNLPDLPPGEYTISAWHEVFGEEKQKVTVTAGEPLELEFSFTATQHATVEHPDASLMMLDR